MRLEGDVENRGYLDFIRKIKGVAGFGAGVTQSKSNHWKKDGAMAMGQREQGRG